MPSDLGGTLWGEGQSRLSWKGCLLGSEKKRKAALACLEHTSQNPISKQEKYSSHKTPKSAWILQHVAWTAFTTHRIYTFYSLLFATYRYFSFFTRLQFAPQKIIRIFLELAHQSCPQYIIRTDESSESYFWHLPLRQHISLRHRSFLPWPFAHFDLDLPFGKLCSWPGLLLTLPGPFFMASSSCRTLLLWFGPILSEIYTLALTFLTWLSCPPSSWPSPVKISSRQFLVSFWSSRLRFLLVALFTQCSFRNPFLAEI